MPATRVRQAAIGLQKIREKNRLAKAHYPAFRDFFQKQRDQVLKQLDALAKYFPDPEVKTNKTAAEIRAELLKEFNGIWDDVEKGSTKDLQELVTAAEMDGMEAGGKFGEDTINPGGITPTSKTFSLENPRAVAFFKKTGGSVDYIKGIQTTTGDQLRTIIADALETGQSYSKTAKIISDAFDGPISRDRAQTIAVYETAQAYENGNREFAASIADEGVNMEKKYQTSEDDLVSDLCQGNQDDGWIPLDEAHSSGVQQPPGHVRCRCYEIYREAQGGSD